MAPLTEERFLPSVTSTLLSDLRERISLSRVRRSEARDDRSSAEAETLWTNGVCFGAQALRRVPSSNRDRAYSRERKTELAEGKETGVSPAFLSIPQLLTLQLFI